MPGGFTERRRMRTSAIELDVVLNCCHGGPGEDGTLTGLLELAGLAVSGPRPQASALMMDKLAAAGVAKAFGVPTIETALLPLDGDGTKVLSSLPPTPWVVKPRFGGSSLGVEAGVDDLDTARALAGRGVGRAGMLVQPLLDGWHDVNIAVRTSGGVQLSEIERPLREGSTIYGYHDKYLAGGGGAGMDSAPRELPANLPAKVREQILDHARTLVAAFGITGAPTNRLPVGRRRPGGALRGQRDPRRVGGVPLAGDRRAAGAPLPRSRRRSASRPRTRAAMGGDERRQGAAGSRVDRGQARVTIRAFLDGAIIAERQAGAGPVLLAMHGWARDRRDMVRLVDGHAALVPDLPGFGSSPAPPDAWGAAEYASAVAAMLESDGAAPYVVVGHSFGGRVAAVLAAERPELVAGVVFLAAPLVRLAPASKPPFAYRMARLLHRTKLLPEASMERMRQRYGSSDYRAAHGVMRGSVGAGGRRGLQRLRAPHPSARGVVLRRSRHHGARGGRAPGRRARDQRRRRRRGGRCRP